MIFKRLTWMDYFLLLLLAGFFGYVAFQIAGVLNYKWQWHLIPNYIIRIDEDTGEWFSNLLMKGFITTIRISIYSGILALILGTILGIARCANHLTIRMLARTYLEFFRNLPPVVIFLVFYYCITQPMINASDIEGWARGIARQENNEIWTFFFGEMRRFPELVAGTIVLALFESAFIGEIIRAGIQSIGKGQREAAASIGMNRYTELRYIIMPQALKKLVPPLANQFISLVKDSAFISLISVQELTYSTVELATSTRAIFESWITTALFYFIICFSLSMIFRRLEQKKQR